MEKKNNQPNGELQMDRTTGTGGKESVSRSGKVNENDDTGESSGVDENQVNRLDEQDAGTGLSTDRKQRRG